MQFRFHVSITSVLTNPWIAICIFPGIAMSSENCLGACGKFNSDIIPYLFADGCKVRDDLHLTNRICLVLSSCKTFEFRCDVSRGLGLNSADLSFKSATCYSLSL